MPKISVIIPVYKVEKYLKRCVESVLAQTYRDLEIILVDDGSPDRCPTLCEELAATDTRVKVIHKENGGLSSARNAGIAAASGAYIGFVDSDDYILPEMYEKLYHALCDNDADISICNYAYVDEDTGAIDEEKAAEDPVVTEVLTREQAYEKINQLWKYSYYYVTAWNKLYKKELFEGCLFAEGKLHEDEFIVHYLFEKCQQVAVTGDVLYMYVQRQDSITNSTVSLKRLDAVYAIYDRYCFFADRGYSELAYAQLRGAYGFLLYLLPLLPKKAGKEVNRAVGMVFGALARKGNLRAGKLLLAWIRYLCR